ncbi:MAG: tungsten formylmethanofuran dehydrogenase [Deltaproteobacteria bacterium]|nr:MAG: tungsten formylmethanofuran dehydrogenase [Deltaproteobacteria bacterium]
MAKVKFFEERCKGCGLCVTACPKRLITVSARLNRSGYPVAEIADMKSCTACALCAEMCPDVVITVFK